MDDERRELLNFLGGRTTSDELEEISWEFARFLNAQLRELHNSDSDGEVTLEMSEGVYN